MTAAGGRGEWRALRADLASKELAAEFEAPAGGWYRLDVRVVRGEQTWAEARVDHVGVGEVFVVAGQSNAANYGEEKQSPKTGRVACFDGRGWRIADDPQGGAGGSGGSFMPALGDALVAHFDVPVGFIPCAVGATSVREWLPEGAAFPDPPTLVGRVRQLPDGRWASKGEAYETLVSRMKSAGPHPHPHGFRAVLWHQGESDANQKDPGRTLPGKLYREYLEKVIRDSRKEIGWDAPWFVAQASYHVPGDEASPDIRAAQASLWEDGVALQGPDTDALKGDLRERGGKGVHFSAKACASTRRRGRKRSSRGSRSRPRKRKTPAPDGRSPVVRVERGVGPVGSASRSGGSRRPELSQLSTSWSQAARLSALLKWLGEPSICRRTSCRPGRTGGAKDRADVRTWGGVWRLRKGRFPESFRETRSFSPPCPTRGDNANPSVRQVLRQWAIQGSNL